MEAFLHQVFSGIATGSIYAAMALALVMIYQSTQVVNFAQGEMAMFSTFIAWFLMQHGVPYWFTFIATVVISFAIGAAIERVVIRPLHNAPEFSVIIVMIGLYCIINSLAGLFFTTDVRSFPSPFNLPADLMKGFMSPHEMGIIIVVLLVLAIVFCFFRFTSLGLAMRAAAQNPLSSRLVGIRVGNMLAIGWGLAAILGAIAGMMAAPVVLLDPNMMGTILIYGFAGSLLGGITNPWGAVIGGIIVGVLENIVGEYTFVGTALKLTVALAVIIIVVTLKPSGLFGHKTMERV